MVTQVASLGRSGLSDWIIQRISAVILAVYTVVLVGWVLLQGDLTYDAWRSLFASTWMQVFTLMALVATCAHAWIGVWTVGTDYLRSHTMGEGGDSMRIAYLVVCLLIVLAYLFWGIRILWGV